MSNALPEKDKDTQNSTTSKPDPETLNTTDPQEHMEGPVSSLMQNSGESFEENGSSKGDDDVSNS